MKLVKVSVLKFSEIKKLIRLCKESGVTEFSQGELKVVFGVQTKDIPLTPPAIQTKEAEVQTQQIEKESLFEASRALDEDDLALMSIEDPSRYEQMLIEGELEDDDSGTTTRDVEQRAIDSSLEAAARAQET